MAPSPEYDKEPKAPDKSATDISIEDSKGINSIATDQQNNSDHKNTNNTIHTEIENNKHVEALDDGELRALLDEAITYKRPKDREGKSILFNELLEKVEQDEQQACEAAALSLGGRGRRGGSSHHSNSLQDVMVAALKADTAAALRRHRHHPPAPPTPSVSARATHGGSLPSGVDTSSLLSEDVGSCRGGYLATVRCVNPPPLTERRVSASDANTPAEIDPINRRSSKPMFPMYTARATLEIGSGSVGSGRAVTTTTASNQVDSAIPFSCITTPEVVASCNTTSSTSQSAVAVDPKPRSVISNSFNGLSLTKTSYGSTGTSASDDYKKSLDENGNSVQGFSSPLSGSSQHKKPRKKKSTKNETLIDCRKIDGYQGDKDVNELLRFIESNAESSRGHKLGRAKHEADDKTGKKRSTERRKDKDKVKRATSMEELSRTKLEDLTEPRHIEPTKPERRSWGDERPDDPPTTELTDFQTVTKKRKPRRRTDEPPVTRAPPAPCTPPRHSAPPSDRSNDSNDDMDSVHSLHSLPAQHHPPASYADIARTRHNIPDLIESCNYYEPGEAGGAPPQPDNYPALETRAAIDTHVATPMTKPARRKEPDVVADRRPAVILVDSGTKPRDMDGVTFGFDINEQLVGRRCDLVRDAGVSVRAGQAALRYVPPHPLTNNNHLLQIIDYVGHAWEDVVRCGSGKVHYFSE